MRLTEEKQNTPEHGGFEVEVCKRGLSIFTDSLTACFTTIPAIWALALLVTSFAWVTSPSELQAFNTLFSTERDAFTISNSHTTSSNNSNKQL